ncbi:MAG: hypothetical protein LH702_16210 [Phormidesmis sp. CAN_BIN44]|nr:hypothetical protein [Phormidesmis sp. CAN_BIN44]
MSDYSKRLLTLWAFIILCSASLLMSSKLTGQPMKFVQDLITTQEGKQ